MLNYDYLMFRKILLAQNCFFICNLLEQRPPGFLSSFCPFNHLGNTEMAQIHYMWYTVKISLPVSPPSPHVPPTPTNHFISFSGILQKFLYAKAVFKLSNVLQLCLQPKFWEGRGGGSVHESRSFHPASPQSTVLHSFKKILTVYWAPIKGYLPSIALTDYPSTLTKQQKCTYNALHNCLHCSSRHRKRQVANRHLHFTHEETEARKVTCSSKGWNPGLTPKSSLLTMTLHIGKPRVSPCTLWSSA